MPKKGKDKEDYAYLKKKIKKLKRKIHRKRNERRCLRSMSSRQLTSLIDTLRLDGSEQDEIASTSAQVAADTVERGLGDAATKNSAHTQPTLIESSNIIVSEHGNLVSQLDDTILEILGIQPTQANIFGAEIEKELAIRLEHYACNGLTKDVQKELQEKYLVPSNCKLINAPVLNAELKGVLSEALANRDKAIEVEQVRLASAISALSQALTKLFSYNQNDASLINILMDAIRLLCDCQHSHSMRRRRLILSSLRKGMRHLLKSTTKIDNYLFGQGLAEALKAAKAVNESGTDLEATPAEKYSTNKKQPAKTVRNLNWKGPIQPGKQLKPFRPKETAGTRNRQSNSSKPSHRPQRNTKR